MTDSAINENKILTLQSQKEHEFSTLNEETMSSAIQPLIQNAAQPRVCAICGKPYVKRTFKILNREKVLYCCDCNCYKKREKEEEQKRWAEALRKKYERANIGKRYIDVTLQQLEALGTEHVEDAYKYIREFNPENGNSLHLIGEFGNGKTSVGYATLRQLLSYGFNGLYITWIDIVNRVYYAKSFTSEETVERILADLSHFDILVLDEFVINLKDDKEINLATELFDRLYRDNKCFILINNPCDITDMKTVPRLGKLLDRVRQQAKTLVFKKKSYRSKN